MAGIDKTYLNTYEEYLEVLNWCNKTGIVTDEYGNTFNPKDFLYYPELNEEDFKPGIVLWNTPIYFDLYLIRNCPIKFIQERLEEQYNLGFIQKVINHNSEYDVFQRNGLGKKLKITIIKNPKFKGYYKNTWWWIEIENSYWNYNEYTDKWVHDNEAEEYNTNVCNKYRGKLTIKKIMRILRKWDLPKDLVISIRGSYSGQDWIIKTK